MSSKARACIIALAVLMIAGGLLLMPAGQGIPLLAFGILLLATILLEPRYRRSKAAPEGAAWQKTGERFLDDESGEWVEVWFDPQSGERRYEPAGKPSAARN